MGKWDQEILFPSPFVKEREFQSKKPRQRSSRE